MMDISNMSSDADWTWSMEDYLTKEATTGPSYTVTTVASTPELPIINSTMVITSPDLWQLQVAYRLFIIVLPILFTAGSLCNLLSFIILQSSLFRGTPCSFLLSALAVMDTGVLLTGALRHWIREFTEATLDIRALSRSGCKVHVFFTYLFPQLSSWTLSLVTIERAVSVTLPHRSRDICSQRRMIIAWVVCTIVLCALNLHFMVLFDVKTLSFVEENGDMQSLSLCLIGDEYREFFRRIWQWVDFTFLTVIPLVIIIACNTIIVAKLVNPKIRRHRGPLQNQTTAMDTKTRSTTVMLVAVSSFFFLTQVPAGIYFVGLPYWPYNNLEDAANVYLVYTVTSILSYTQNATNFILYCISGSRFRAAMLIMVGCKKNRRGRTSTFISNNTNKVDERIRSKSTVTACELNAIANDSENTDNPIKNQMVTATITNGDEIGENTSNSHGVLRNRNIQDSTINLSRTNGNTELERTNVSKNVPNTEAVKQSGMENTKF